MDINIISLLNELSSIIIVRLLIIIMVTGLLHIILRKVISFIVKEVVTESQKFHKKRHSIDDKKRADTLVTLFKTSATVVLWVVAFFILLSEIGIDITAVMTGAGLLGIVIGFGAQNSIKDFLAGMFVILENQYRVGDVVTLIASGKEVVGVVEEITIRITKLRDLDGRLHFIPNGAASIVTNHTFGFANVNIDVGVSYNTDIDKLEKVINRVGRELAEDKKWCDSIVEPIQFLRLDKFEDSSIRIKSLGKVVPAMQWEVAGEFRRRLKQAFDKEKIDIPYPQIVIHKGK